MPERRFLITGGAGFIGSHLSEHLVDEGNSVIAIDDLSTGSMKNIEALLLNPSFRFVQDTILNLQALDRLVSQVDVIVHLAAAVGVKLIIEDPVRTINTNILGTELYAENREPLRLQSADCIDIRSLRQRGESALQRR